MALDTPTGLKKPNSDTDPWVVKTLTRIDERQQGIKDDMGTVKNWVSEHDVRHRKIDGRLALVGVAIPIGTGIVVWVVTTLMGG